MMNGIFSKTLMNKDAFLRNAHLCGFPFSTERSIPTECRLVQNSIFYRTMPPYGLLLYDTFTMHYHSAKNKSLDEKNVIAKHYHSIKNGLFGEKKIMANRYHSVRNESLGRKAIIKRQPAFRRNASNSLTE